MSNQINGKQRVNVEYLVNQFKEIREQALKLAEQQGVSPCSPFLQATVPDVLTLIRSIDPTLLKSVFAANQPDYSQHGSPLALYIYASFGLPNETYTVTLYAKE